MDCYVLEIKKVSGNRVTNDDKLASVYYTNATHDTLCYCAPIFGEYIRAVAVQAKNIDEAMKAACEKWIKS